MKKEFESEFLKREIYTPPIISVYCVELEESIVNSSAVIEGPTSGNQPDVTDWENQDDNYDWEF